MASGAINRVTRGNRTMRELQQENLLAADEGNEKFSAVNPEAGTQDEVPNQNDVASSPNTAKQRFNSSVYVVGVNDTIAHAMSINASAALRQQQLDQHLSLSSSSPLYERYQVTLILIAVIHLMFFYQWNKKRSKNDVMASYRILVQKKQFHRAWLAMLSHPQTSTNTSGRNRQSLFAVNYGNDDNDDSNSTGHNNDSGLRRCWNLSKWALGGPLSGLPLLAYNSHILWTCRALEPMLASHWEYARMLLGLTLVGLLMELRLSFNVLAMNRAFIGFGPETTHYNNTRRTEQTRKAVLSRSIGTCTLLAAALLTVYRNVFPFVTLKLLPIYLPFRNSGEFGEATTIDPSVSYVFCLVVLTILSWKSHPGTSVLCGTMSGLFWSSGFTSFLSSAYWGSCLLIIVLVMTALSMRSSSTRLASYVPCIDYVSWDERGVLYQRDQGARGRESSVGDADHDDSSEDGSEQMGDVETGPLVRRRSSSHMSSEGEEAFMHGRLPSLDVLDMDDVSRVPPPRSSPRPSSDSRGLSRRGVGSSSLHAENDHY